MEIGKLRGSHSGVYVDTEGGTKTLGAGSAGVETYAYSSDCKLLTPDDAGGTDLSSDFTFYMPGTAADDAGTST